ncbi:MAG: uncharacterized protein KVP18_004684 [Porospora cf. gigantea A]|uniref:uncharacterized protein n=1 Tax=Porospora cf. gigantea A TaxID=2853593 RepID=UPI003559CCDA|nr:MAG: hypothetical protein KVP18_004684 [Porospora cf. gigantea A]
MINDGPAPPHARILSYGQRPVTRSPSVTRGYPSVSGYPRAVLESPLPRPGGVSSASVTALVDKLVTERLNSFEKRVMSQVLAPESPQKSPCPSCQDLQEQLTKERQSRERTWSTLVLMARALISVLKENDIEVDEGEYLEDVGSVIRSKKPSTLVTDPVRSLHEVARTTPSVLTTDNARSLAASAQFIIKSQGQEVRGLRKATTDSRIESQCEKMPSPSVLNESDTFSESSNVSEKKTQFVRIQGHGPYRKCLLCV